MISQIMLRSRLKNKLQYFYLAAELNRSALRKFDTCFPHCIYLLSLFNFQDSFSLRKPFGLLGWHNVHKSTCFQASFHIIPWWAQCAQVHLFPSFLSHHTVVGTSGLEPPTSRLSGVRSNHLSYAPLVVR